MFRVGLSSFLESISKIKQTTLFWHFLQILKQQQCQLGPCCAALWDGCRLSIPCVLQYAGGVSMGNWHNFHYTSYTENYTQRIVDSQGAACLLHSKIRLWSFDLCTLGWYLHWSSDLGLQVVCALRLQICGL